MHTRIGRPTKPFLCSTCGQDDPSKFKKNYKGVCIKCLTIKRHQYKLWRAQTPNAVPYSVGRPTLPYNCRICNTTDPSEFSSNKSAGKTLCKKCSSTRYRSRYCDDPELRLRNSVKCKQYYNNSKLSKLSLIFGEYHV